MADEEKQKETQAEKPDRYKGIKSDIVEDLKRYETLYFKEDLPVPFKGLNIYPVTMHDYERFFSCIDVFTMDKNKTPEGVRMTQLDYTIHKMMNQDDPESPTWTYKMHTILELIFHIKNGLRCKSCGHVMSYTDPEFLGFIDSLKQSLTQLTEETENQEQIKLELKCPKCGSQEFAEMIKIVKDEKNPKKHNLIVNGVVINAQDFNKIRYTVLFQNMPEYRDDSWVDSDIKADYEARIRLEQQKNDVSATVEKKMVALSITTNYKLPEIYDMTIRKFSMALGLVEDLIQYKILTTAAASGLSGIKADSIEHWLYKREKDMYGDRYKSQDQAMSEVSTANR